jgi:hypothetical protein
LLALQLEWEEWRPSELKARQPQAIVVGAKPFSKNTTLQEHDIARTLL